MNILGVNLALDDVEDRDIAALLAWVCRDHAVLGLEKAAHDVQDGGFPHGLGLLDVVASERSVGGHEEVTAWCGDQGGDDADKIVMHIARITESGCASRHDRRYLEKLACD